jgi:hypothetical protein
MNYPLFSDLSTKLKNDLDLNEETFIKPEEIQALYNEAVEMVEGTIHTVYEDYFMTMNEQNVTSGQSEVDLPSNIYANKIRKAHWVNGDADKYEMMPIKNINDTLFVNANDSYRYIILNPDTAGMKLKIYPAFNATYTNSPLKIWYLRGANRYVDETSLCDIPQFSNIINQYVRWKCHLKEGHPDTSADMESLDRMMDLMIQTLSNRVIDENTEIRKDLSHYVDFDSYNYWYGN